MGGKDQLSFIKLVVDEVRRINPKAAVVVDESDFSVVVDDGRMFLGSVYQHWRQAPFFKRRSVITRFVSGLLEARAARPMTREEVFAAVVPVVRQRAFIESILRHRYTEGEIDAPVWKPIGSHFAGMLVLDQPDAMAYVTPSSIADWDTTFDDLFAHGRQALVATTSESGFKEVHRGVFRSTYDNDYDTSILFAPGVLKKLKINGDPVVAPASRRTFLVCGADDDVAVSHLVNDAIAAQSTDPSPISARLLRLDGFTWHDFLPGKGHPAYTAAQLAWYGELSTEYGHQRAFMEETLVEGGLRDVYVAPYKAFETEEGVHSETLWAPGLTDTLLPKADRITLGRTMDAKGLWSVTSETLLEVCGHRLTDSGDYPPLWHATTSPTEDEYDRLEASQLP